jgi:predicted esterase
MKTALCILFGFLTTALPAQQKAYVSPSGTKFLLYTPASYATSEEEFPLLISLHGKGEWGDDLTKLTSGNPTGMPSKLIHNNQWPQTYEFIVLTPQYNPPDVNDPNPIWPAAHIDEVVNYVFSLWRIKKHRVYVTGLSFGANATWNYAAAYPDKVAAIVPISGRADFTKACLLKDIPAWVFHGDGDVTATQAYSRDMVQAIDNCIPSGLFNRQFNVLYTKNHEGWSEVYNGSSGYRIYDWLLKHTKGSSSNPAPYVNAGPDIFVKADAGQVTVPGDVFDSRGTISSITWRQTLGLPLTLSDTNSSSLTVGDLQPGTFELELSATDNQSAKASNRMVLKVYSSSSLPVVSDLVLLDGASGQDLLMLVDGMVIDKEMLGTDQFNIRAQASANTKSVRFSVNTFRNTRTVNAPGPYVIKAPHATRPEWEIAPGEYVICATPFSSPGAGGLRGISKCVKIQIVEGVPTAGCEGAGIIYREVWPGVPGKYISDIPLSTSPSFASPLHILEGPTGETGAGDNYAARIRGYLCPPVTGKYRFWIASDERSELWLSTDDTPEKKVRIAYVNGYTNAREWTKFGSQMSMLKMLTAGTRYYIEVLHKEARFADHVAVGWQLPDGTMQRPIPGIRLIPFNDSQQSQLLTDAESSGEINLYPNPVTGVGDVLTLRGFATHRTRPVGALVMDPNGQIIKRISVNCQLPCDDIVIELDGPLPVGIYSIHVLTEKGRISKRFVVRR